MRRVFELERANRMDALWKKQGIHERITAREEKIEKARVEKHAARVETTNAIPKRARQVLRQHRGGRNRHGVPRGDEMRNLGRTVSNHRETRRGDTVNVVRLFAKRVRLFAL